MCGGVYKISNVRDGKFYVGSAKDIVARWGEHRRDLAHGRHNNPRLQNVWNKHGAGVFEFRTLLICAPKDLLDYEQRCIDGLKPEYNIAQNARAPFTGLKHTPRALQKISAGNKGKKVPQAHIERMAATNRGRKLSAAHKAKVVASLLGNTRRRGKKFGPMSVEHKAKIAAALRAFHSRRTS